MKTDPKIVTAFTEGSYEYYRPPQFVVGELVVRHVFGYDQHLVDGICVIEATVRPVSNPTPELIRMLKDKAAKWARADRTLSNRRARKDDSFRGEDEESLVREDQEEAFSAFCDEMDREDERLISERQAEVAELLRKHRRTAR